MVALSVRYSQRPDLVRALDCLGGRIVSRRVDAAPVTPRRLALRLTPDQQAELVTGYKDGQTAASLGRRFGLSKTATLAQLRRAGVEIRRQPLTPNQVSDGARLYEQGSSIASTAKQLGVPLTSLARALVSAGVRLRPGPRSKGRVGM